jgi:hypothetical protein
MRETVSMASVPIKRVVVFDDSRDALIQFATILRDRDCELQLYRRPVIDDDLEKILIAFNPHLVVVDLVLGETREDGYKLIKQITSVPQLKDIPIVVCSKLITESAMGKAQAEYVKESLGVREAFGKAPEFPSADSLLSFARKG